MLNNYLKLIIMNKNHLFLKTLSLILISLVLFSCDPSYTTTYIYKNNTPDSVLLYSYANNKVDNDTVILKPQMKDTILIKNVFGGPALLSYELYDSIVITKKDKKLVYTRISQDLNSIYDLDNWELKKKGKYNLVYTYHFDEIDFK